MDESNLKPKITVEIEYDFIVSTLLIYLLLFSVILSLMQEIDFFSFLFDSLKTDFDRGFYSLPSILLMIILLLPPALAFFFFLLGYLDILTNRFKMLRLKKYLAFLAFGAYAIPMIFLLIFEPLFYILGLIYVFFILYALKNYIYFTSKEMPVSVIKVLEFKIPLIKRSFSRLKPYSKVFLFIIAMFFILKNVFIQFNVAFEVFINLKELLMPFTLLIELFDGIIDFFTPLADYFSHLIQSLDIAFLSPLIDFFSFIERILVKLIMYLFVLDIKLPTFGQSATGKMKIGNITSSGFALVGLRDVNLEQSIYWLSTISLLTVLMLEFFFTFINIITGVDLNEILGFLTTTFIWIMVVIYLIKDRNKPIEA